MQEKETSKEILGLNRITKKRILELCRKDKLYQTPGLNDVLYLHYQGFDCIECLEEYTDLKCLWLECNAISEIQGLDKQTKLKCLFLQSNLIRKIENLESCKDLDTLNLSQNQIRKIENCGFEVLPVLNTLNLASNYLRDCDALKELENCNNLSVLDLSNNRIDDILVVKIFSQMPALKVLVLQGNPVVSKIPQYRKTLILECKNLTYLDSRPVFPKDRACAEAWKRGGYQEERKENERWNRKDRKKMRDSVNATIHLRNKNRKLDDQISLIPSSDSEDDSKRQNKNVRLRMDSKACTDCIWDEVAENEKLEEPFISDDFKNSKTNYSLDCGDKDEEAIDVIINGVDNSKIIKDEQSMDANQLLETSLKNLNSEQESCNGEQRIIISHSGSEDGKDYRETNQTDSEVYQQENCETVIEAIEKLTKSEDFVEVLFEEQVENYNTDKNTEEENYEPLKELENTMNILSQPVAHEPSFSSFETKMQKPLLELEIEQEHVKINNQINEDFDELTTNLSQFVNNQLIKEQAERQEIINAPFNEERTANESCCKSSDNEEQNSLEKLDIERVIDHWDNKSKVKKELMQNKAMKMAKLNENFRDEMLYEDQKSKKNILTGNYNTFFEADRDKKPPENTYGKELDDKLEYIPMDVSLLTRKSNEAWESLERESNKLKILLQKLENKNEEVFKNIDLDKKYQIEDTSYAEQEKSGIEITMAEKEYEINNFLHKHIQNDVGENKGEQIQKGTDKKDQRQIVDTIVEELLQSLELVHIKKSYEFPEDLADNYDEYNLSPQQSTRYQVSTKSIPEVIQSFNEFLNKIEIDYQQENKCSVEGFDTQRSHILKESSHKSNLKQFNTDTFQALDNQLEEMERNRHEKVRRMIDRVYAQKDRYNDTLELSGGKLMVRNKDTEQLQELPPPFQYNTSDSEDDYNTALSEEEDTNGKEILRTKRFQPRSYKPTARKSNEDLVVKAIIENTPNNPYEDSEESNDEFYSLNDHDKQKLYDIDDEFFNKLTFDISNLSQTDENHIVQCAKSYEDLKNYLTLSKEERCLTEEETDLLENMIKAKCVQTKENLENPLKTLQDNNDLSKEEQLWFNKMSLKYHEPKTQDEPKRKCSESTCSASGDKHKLEKNSDIMIEQKFLKNILEGKTSDDRKSVELCIVVEQQSEEEKNEIENNIDLESCAVNVKKIDCKEISGFSYEKPKVDRDEENLKSRGAILEKSAKSSCDADVFECNLEIIADNDESMEAITVNADLFIL